MTLLRNERTGSQVGVAAGEDAGALLVKTKPIEKLLFLAFLSASSMLALMSPQPIQHPTLGSNTGGP